MNRENFEAWWVSENDGHQPRSSWSALRTEDGYNDEDIDLQWQGYQAATASMQAERDQLAAECAALKEYISEKCYIVDPKADLTANADIPAEDFQPQTPATDRFLAEQRAQAVEMFAESQKAYVRDNRNSLDAMNRAAYCGSALDAERFAAQLRNEVKV